MTAHETKGGTHNSQCCLPVRLSEREGTLTGWWAKCPTTVHGYCEDRGIKWRYVPPLAEMTTALLREICRVSLLSIVDGKISRAYEFTTGILNLCHRGVLARDDHHLHRGEFVKSLGSSRPPCIMTSSNLPVKRVKSSAYHKLPWTRAGAQQVRQYLFFSADL